MYKARADRSGFAHFASCNDDGTPDRLTTIGQLRQALDRQELVLHYQPKIAIHTGELLGVEVLIRWQHPTRGLLFSNEFIPLAEGSTLIHRLATTVIDQALRFCRTSLNQAIRLPIAINISTRNLYNPDFPTIIANRLAYAGVPADLLTIEITEGSVTAYPDVAQNILQQLCDMGVRISVHEIKIDRSFIAGMTSDPNDTDDTDAVSVALIEFRDLLESLWVRAVWSLRVPCSHGGLLQRPPAPVRRHTRSNLSVRWILRVGSISTLWASTATACTGM